MDDIETDPFWITDWENTPSGAMKIHLDKKLYWDDQGGGFGYAPSVYPVTITHSRYNGTYEGGPLGAAGWLCFPVSPHRLSDPEWADWNGSDIECMQWWDRARKEEWPIGRGINPGYAYLDLIRQVAAKAGVELDSLFEEPSWPAREESGSDGEDLPESSDGPGEG